MIKSKLIKLSILSTSILSMGLMGHVAAATQSIEISPTNLIQAFDKGTNNSESLTVINPGTEAVDISLSATPFSVSGESYSQDFTAIPGKEDDSKWFSFPSTSYHLNPGQTLSVPYNIDIPSDALAGGHYATVFVKTTNTPASGLNGVAIQDSLGEIAYMTVNGPVKVAGSFLSWNVPFLQKSNLTASVRVQNSGGVHFVANINAKVQDIFGSTKVVFNNQHEVLPQTIRRIDLTWTKTPSFGLYKVSGTMTYLNNTVNLPGRYILVMSVFVRLIVLALVLLIAIWIIIKIRYSNKLSKNKTNSSKKVSKSTIKKPVKYSSNKNNSKKSKSTKKR